uniref:thiamine-triphosphatase n=1 Tax=Euleptes europaea TaxID=460621 RepID=UPI0025402B23|nr:thiamine-triphosphatase [Euleptes europaea]
MVAETPAMERLVVGGGVPGPDPGKGHHPEQASRGKKGREDGQRERKKQSSSPRSAAPSSQTTPESWPSPYPSRSLFKAAFLLPVSSSSKFRNGDWKAAWSEGLGWEIDGTYTSAGRKRGPAGAADAPGRRGAGSPASGSIEVEQKFLFGPGTEEKLVALGATLAGNVSFRDRYFDTPDWRLSMADHWLRKREGTGWELKCPPEGAGVSGPATEYREVTCPLEIVAHVCGLLSVDLPAGLRNDVARAVEELGLEEFASFVTHRRKYRVAGLSVDLDKADFGYAVGEVEDVVGRQEDVPEALERIQELGRKLADLDEKTRIPGKMSVYLHKFRPEHYERLVRDGRLRKVRDTEAA